MERGWLAVAAAALLAAPGVSRCQEASGRLDLPEAAAKRIELVTLVLDADPAPRILQSELTFSGIDPWDVRRTLQAYNLRSELAQITQDSVVLAPYLLQRTFNLRSNQYLQLRLKGQSVNLVFWFTWQ
jgi:hypothetical protein